MLDILPESPTPKLMLLAIATLMLAGCARWTVSQGPPNNPHDFHEQTGGSEGSDELSRPGIVVRGESWESCMRHLLIALAAALALSGCARHASQPPGGYFSSSVGVTAPATKSGAIGF